MKTAGKTIREGGFSKVIFKTNRVLKTALLFGFFLVFYAQPLPGEEPSPGGGPDGESYFFEEFFIYGEPFIFEKPLFGETPLIDEETLLGGKPFPAEEPIPGEESFPAEESPPDGETRLVEKPVPDEKPSPAEESPPGEETRLAEEPSPNGGPDGGPGAFDDEEDFFDDGTFVFEAPPLIFEAPVFKTRSFDEIYSNFSRDQKAEAMSDEGLRFSFGKDEPPTLLPDPDSGIDLLSVVMKKKPSHLIEALVVVPYKKRELDLLDIYNALGRIENIKDHPAPLHESEIYIFTESTRIESPRNRKSVPDPPPAFNLPFSQTMYLRLKEINFGNLFIRGEISISLYGLTYNMTNFADVRYFLLPVMRAERFITVIYLEPVKEGILIYSMTGFYLPGFIADRVNLTPNINRRITVFINWIIEGLRKQESQAAERENETL